jgi:(1->4)-alpha-D-glucan 1-alpha-D-glucosylmutase
VLPVLGGDLDEVLGAARSRSRPRGDDDGFGTARYYDLVLPLARHRAAARDDRPPRGARRAGAPALAGASWRRDAEELNYRRFFTVTSLAGVRVELPDVFAASHVEILRWVREGSSTVCASTTPTASPTRAATSTLAAAVATRRRVDPRLSRLVEKILEPGEELPGWWATTAPRATTRSARSTGCSSTPPARRR